MIYTHTHTILQQPFLGEAESASCSLDSWSPAILFRSILIEQAKTIPIDTPISVVPHMH